MLGRKHSDEAKKKMMKKKHSAAEKERMSLRGKEYKGINNPFYGKKHTEAFKQKLSNFKKIPIICITNGIEYDCAKTAASALGLTQSHVTQVCNGRYKAAKGYVFKYDL
jgi:hypothetical protein